jgi:hypothetical protein
MITYSLEITVDHVARMEVSEAFGNTRQLGEELTHHATWRK